MERVRVAAQVATLAILNPSRAGRTAWRILVGRDAKSLHQRVEPCRIHSKARAHPVPEVWFKSYSRKHGEIGK